MNYKEFFSKYPVFTLDELRNAKKDKKEKSVYNSLKYYLQKGRVHNIKRGLYYVIPEGSSPDKFQPNSILIASQLSKDSAISFHTAFEVLGYGHSIFHRFFYYSPRRKRNFNFRGEEFICVKIPEKLKRKGLEMLGVDKKYFHNQQVKSTNRERTLIDCLDRPEYAGGIEEVYRCIEKYPYLNFEKLLEYLYARGKKILFARVGFFLEQHREQFYVDKELLEKLHKEQPSSIVYFDPKRRKGKFVKYWNLIVPEKIILREWEEF